MKRFRFPLRPVAVLRAHREVRAREAFAAALQRHAAAQDECRRIGLRMRALEAALFNGREKSFRAAEAALLLSDYRRECGAESEAERQVIAAHGDMQKARADYLEAHRQLEIVDRLEEKAREAHRYENNRSEQAEMDELAGQRRVQPFSLSL
jgi:flagellar FliJ protein